MIVISVSVPGMLFEWVKAAFYALWILTFTVVSVFYYLFNKQKKLVRKATRPPRNRDHTFLQSYYI